MSVFGGILIFAFGMAAGLGLAVGICVLVKRALSDLRRRNRHLEVSAWRDRLEFETDKAFRAGYHRGYRKGRTNPITDVERLAATIQEKRMDFRGPARRDGN